MNAEELQQCRNSLTTSVTYLKSNVRNGIPGYVSRVDRMREVNDMCDQYIEATGERPDPDQLERLADAILHEELSDKRRDKVTIEESPILSEHQFNRRKFGGRTNKQGIKLREVPLSVAAYVGTDGVDYRDACTIARKATNSERKKRYREFTKDQPVSTYNIEGESK